MTNPKVLYISYDGALEPVGESQVLPYLRGLAERGSSITLISFEKPEDWRSDRFLSRQSELAAQGIKWVPLKYHKRPTVLATSFDIAVCFIRGLWLIRRDRVEFVHARSYVAALVAWLLKKVARARFLFDMRGFWADERVEGGLWPAGGFLYRLTKRLERRFLRDADEIVSLTERGREAIGEMISSPQPVTVIPTCVDLTRFTGPATQDRRAPLDGAPDRDGSPVFVYTGSLGTWYPLTELLHFVEEASALHPGARLLLVSRSIDKARKALSASSLPAGTVELATAAHADVPDFLARATVGVAFYKPGFGRRGTSPIKIAEYLAMGLPVVVNDEVGDSPAILRGHRVGVVISQFSRDAYRQALQELECLRRDPTLPSRCRQVAETVFSLETGTARYWAIYRRLSEKPALTVW